MIKKLLLYCGVLSSLLYVFMNIICALRFDGYSSFSQTVSELSAIGAPTRQLWVEMCLVFNTLMIAFGLGVRISGSRKTNLRIAGKLLMIVGLIGFAWPPMHQRAVLASKGPGLTDTLHIAFTVVTSVFMLLAMGFGAAALGMRFRIYSILTIFVLLVFGALTGLDAQRVQANLPTPWTGVWERINIAAFLLWIVVLAITLLSKERYVTDKLIMGKAEKAL